MDAALVILDGWGIGDHDRRNAVATASTPTFDRIVSTSISGQLSASGRDVGLPDGQMGNSEVGHLNIGAGRVVTQPFTRIEDAIEDGSFFENEVLVEAVKSAARANNCVHFMGLMSPGGVHSHQRHLKALLKLASKYNAESTTHAFLDGRDTPPKSATSDIETIQQAVAEYETGSISTIMGRYYAMDRDENWSRTKQAYDAIVNREAQYQAETPIEALNDAYEREETDEFVIPTTISDGIALSEGDTVVFFNFRPDRARQLVRTLTDTDPEWEYTTTPPEIKLVTMTEYDEEYEFPVAYPPDEPEATLGTVLADQGLTQLRIAESEKYPHVTYFINGGREGAFEGEIREIVSSPDVPTYDEQPEMSAAEVTNQAISIINESDPNVLVLNYANPDMVGHTGDFEAAVTAVETVDHELGRLLGSLDCPVIIIADHGNADDMGTPENPHTAHTTNPVPFIYVPKNRSKPVDITVRSDGRLADVVPTLLSLLGIQKPTSMTGESLLIENPE
ncbi:2,3-bisphosphoglycerate-independent phosphoglycerate mutase [Salinarchaeum sp. IM2453]|uniref:2,3-bisphosphoglycerate-independent phosphoglycerate mutase n=1 Tax=Salinarchaeum sp. IM2453 TaxID=2862870 RepID=UPI001C83E8B6|nr:2,3-bisphosphoglycerate-independent phosphoglycerate mutase [Salinarchaeum sp. IM2453]QZA87602.1 2,3-bisphosphoglycerate-independent phosphoglycerate mutase [Salinarchaeum sp. IM2453]